MTEKKPLRRKSGKGRLVALGVGGAVLLALTVTLLLKLETIKTLIEPGTIEAKSELEVEAGLMEGDFVNIQWGESRVTYQTADDAFFFDVKFENEKPSDIKGVIHIDRVRINTLGEAVSLGKSLLSPYFKDTDVEALALLLTGSLSSKAAEPNLDHETDIGRYSVRVMRDGGEVFFSVVEKSGG